MKDNADHQVYIHIYTGISRIKQVISTSIQKQITKLLLTCLSNTRQRVKLIDSKQHSEFVLGDRIEIVKSNTDWGLYNKFFGLNNNNAM